MQHDPEGGCACDDRCDVTHETGCSCNITDHFADSRIKQHSIDRLTRERDEAVIDRRKEFDNHIRFMQRIALATMPNTGNDALPDEDRLVGEVSDLREGLDEQYDLVTEYHNKANANAARALAAESRVSQLEDVVEQGKKLWADLMEASAGVLNAHEELSDIEPTSQAELDFAAEIAELHKVWHAQPLRFPALARLDTDTPDQPTPNTSPFLGDPFGITRRPTPDQGTEGEG